MKKIITLCFLMALVGVKGWGQNVNVTGATAGNGTYLTLYDAFTAINGGVQTGATINIAIVGNTTEVSSPTLNAGAWTSLTISPSGGAARTITGAIAGNLIYLNGADNVKIDGLNTGSNALTISNTSTGTSSTTIFMDNDATSNTIQNCTILGANSSNASYATIMFGNPAATGTVVGNDNNIISTNNIGPVNALTSTPTMAIYSLGGSSADNSGIQITNNNIYDFFSATNASYGIRINSGLPSGNNGWTITGNHLYQTTTRAVNTAGLYAGISVLAGSGYTISNNVVGFATPTATGTSSYTSTVALRFIGIDLETVGTTTNSVQGNTIGGFTMTTSSGATGTYGIFSGIYLSVPATSVTNVGTTAGNIIGATTGTGSITVTSTTTLGLIGGIVATAASAATVTIQNNIVSSEITGGTSAIGYTFRGISTAGSGAYNIYSNTIGSSSNALSVLIGTSGTTTTGVCSMSGIYNASTGAVAIGGAGLANTIQNIGVYSTSSSSALYGIYNGAAASSLNINNNSISGLFFGSSATAAAGSIYAFYNASTITGTLTISNNTVQNWTNLYTTGTIYLIYQYSNTSIGNYQNNIFSTISRAATATSGTMYGFYNGYFGSFTGNQSFSGNTFSNITNTATTGSGAFTGFYNYSSPSSTWDFSQNVFDNITSGSGSSYVVYQPYASVINFNRNRFSNITTSGSLYGYYLLSTSTSTANIYQDTIYTFKSSGASSTVNPIYTTAVITNIYKNKIYDIQETGTSGIVYGVYTAGGTTHTIYNNLIGDLKAPASTLTAPAPSVAGLYISSGTTINAYYNTIYLNATSTGTNFGTAAVYGSATPTTILLKDNIFANTSTANGTGKAVGYQRSSTTLTNYSISSNNNDFYGTSGLYYDGSALQTNLSSYKALMSTRDQASFTESPTFVSTTGSSPFYLHINTTTPTQIESGGSPVSGITDDYDTPADTRNPTTPDVGADEFNGVSSAPTITLVTGPTASCTATSHPVSVNVSTPSGTISSVTITYNIGSGNVVQTMSGATGTSSGTFSYPIPAAPAGTTVTWSVTATASTTLNRTYIGTSYTDAPLTGITATASASPTTICTGSSTTLTGVFGKSGGVATIGNGSTTTGSSSYPTAFGNYWYQDWEQMVYTAAELQAAGLTAGKITALTFTIAALPSPSSSTNYSISLGSTNSSTLSAFTTTGLTTVYAASTITPVVGANTLTFSTPYTWDGTSNILVDIRNTGADGSANATTYYTATAGNTIVSAFTTSNNTSFYTSNPAPTASTTRFNISFTGVKATALSSYSWSNGSTTVGTTNPLTISPTVTASYTVTGTDANGCTLTSSPPVTVTVNPLPTAPTGTNSAQCGTQVPTASVADPNGYTTPTFKWYAAATGGTALQSSTSATYNTAISATTTFFVTVINPTTGCESGRTAVTVTVTQPDAVTAKANGVATSTSVCLNSTVALTAPQTGSNGNVYAYIWTANPQINSGVPSGGTTGQTISVTPTAAGSYTYLVSATDGVCTATSSVAVTVKALPTILSATANPATPVCAGSPVTLTALTGSSTTFNVGQASDLAANLSSLPGYGMYFSTTSAATINSVNIYPSTAGNLTVSLINSGGTTVTSKVFTIASGDISTTVLKNLALGFSIPAGSTGWQLYYDIAINRGAGTYTYPASSNGFSITGNTLDGNNPTSGSRWYFYNWNVTTSTTGSGTYNWVWNPGSLSGNSVTVTPAITTNYTVTATDPATTCSATSSPVTVTVNPLPTAPSFTNNNSQCGTAKPSVTAVDPNGYATPTFNWYAAATGGTALQSSTSATYNTSISATTTFYVSVINPTTGCESGRTAVTVTVNTPDAVTASASPSTACLGSTIALSATKSGSTNTYTYTWTATSANSATAGIGTNTGSPISVTPTAAGTYTYQVAASDATLSCNTSALINVTINALPAITSATASPAAICIGGSSVLTASATSTIDATIGSDNATTKISTDGVPYRTGTIVGNQVHNQYLILASELTAAGYSAGNFTALSFNVTSNGGGTMTGMTFKLGSTTATSLSTTYLTPSFTTVLALSSYSPLTGVNTHTFTTPFAWNGTSNIVIDECATLGTSGGGCTMATYSTSVNTTVGTSTSTGCSDPSGTSLSLVRLVIGLTEQIAASGSGNYTWVWNPGNLNGAIVTVSPAATTNYTVTATDPATTCSATSSPVQVTVNPLPTALTATGSTQCGTGVPTASVTDPNGFPTPTIIWYSAATGGTVLQTGTSKTYTSSISATTTFYVTVINPSTGCESVRTPVTATVNIPDAVTASASPTTACLGSTVVLSATKSGTTNTYAYTWSATSSNSSTAGIGTNTGSSISVTPTAAGTYTYQVAASDATLGCNTSALINVTINAKPIVSSVSATPATVCSGSNVTLNSTFITSTGTLGSTTSTTTLGTSGSGGGLSPFSQFYETQHTQYLILASDLTASGLTAGSINGLSFYVFTKNSTLSYSSYSVKLASTTATGLVSGNTSGTFTTVYAGTYTTTSGTNSIPFSTSYSWDGSSNILVDVCFANDPTGSGGILYTDNDIVRATTKSYTATYGYYADNISLCGTTGTSATSSTSLPVITFTESANSALSYSWSDGTTTVGTTNPLTIMPMNTTANAITKSYTVTGTYANGCSATSSPVTVTVNPAPIATFANSTYASCSPAAALVIVNGTTGTTFNYTIGGVAQTPVTITGTSATLNSPTSVGTYNYAITGTSLGSCTSTGGSTTVVTINAAPSLIAGTSSGLKDQSVCKNNAIVPITYNAGGSATTLTVTNLPAGLSVSGNNTATVTISGTPSTIGGTYTITTNGGGCGTASISGAISIQSFITWTGATNTNWNTGGNWCSGSAPSSTADVVIPIVPSNNYPSLPTDITVNSVTINSGATVNNNGFTLTAGTVSGAGTITGSATSSLVTSQSSTVYFTNGFNLLKNLTVNGTGTLTLGNALNIVGGANYGIVSVANGATLVSNGLLTLRSDSLGTAAIAANTSGTNYITGTVTAEQFIPISNVSPTRTGRAWRLITAPVSSTTIGAAWQENMLYNGSAYHKISDGSLTTAPAGYGTMITGYAQGTATNANSHGYDYWSIVANTNSSIRYFVPGATATSGSWQSLTTIVNKDISSEAAYMLFVRGDRKDTTQAEHTTLRATGTVNQVKKDFTIDAAKAYNLMGNPFPSTIDWSLVYSHASAYVQDKFLSWNSKIGTFGAYVLVQNEGGNNYSATPQVLGGTKFTDPTVRFISGGAGFLVYPKVGGTGTATVSVIESDKNAAQVPPANPFRIVATDKKLYVNLNQKTSDTSANLADGFLVRFDPTYTSDIDDDDATKPANFNENLGILSHNTDLIVEARADVQKTDTLHMKLWNVTKRDYQLQLKGDNWASAPGVQAYLVDNYLASKQAVSLTGSVSSVNFTVNSDSASWQSNRFSIVFQNDAVLPLTLTSVKAAAQNGGVNVTWTVRGEQNIKGYTVERSVDGGSSYTAIGSQQAAKNAAGAITNYQSFDAAPQAGDNLYRIRVETQQGVVTYSGVVKVTIGEGSGRMLITLYPNPVRPNGRVSLQLTNLPAGSYRVSVYSGAGQTVYQQKITIGQANTTQSETLHLGSTLAQGNYEVRLSSHTGTILFTDQLVIGR